MSSGFAVRVVECGICLTDFQSQIGDKPEVLGEVAILTDRVSVGEPGAKTEAIPGNGKEPHRLTMIVPTLKLERGGLK